MSSDITETVAFLHERVTRRPRVLLVLGSGLGSLADQLDDALRIPFSDIPGFAPVSVVGHSGTFVAGTLEGTECIALQGRYHMYEGHSPAALSVPVRAAAAIGARTIIVTNAAGGVNRAFRAGDLMLINDHINLMWQNPLVGPVRPGETRFPDMSEPYDQGLQQLAVRLAADLRIPLQRGVYLALSGPSYETPAEIRAFQRLGADAVGMSTIPEVLVARALGLRVLGMSLITNLAAGLSAEPLGHEEVISAGIAAQQKFSSLIRAIVREIGNAPDTEVS